MNKFTIYQSIPAYKPFPTIRIIKSVIPKCKVVLDIEDSIQDVQNQSLTPYLKNKARNDFETIIKNLNNIKVSLRINNLRGNEFIHDKVLLHKYGKNIESIFLPKIENSDDLRIFKNEFGDNFKTCIIIETKKGINNLNQILNSKIISNIDFVFFGNYDYHLDRNIYPVTEQYSKEYWELIKPIIYYSKKHNIGFGNSPYTNINDKKTLEFSIFQLSKLYKHKFAVMSLHKKQTDFFYDLLFKRKFTEKILKINDNSTPLTIDNFISNKQKNRSFALYNNRIITPQEYLLLMSKKKNEKN